MTGAARNRLHQFKKNLQYQNARIRLKRHLRKTNLSPSSSAVPANHLLPSLRDDFNCNCFTSDMLKNACNIQHNIPSVDKCSCLCHSSSSQQMPFFHAADCYENCGRSNKEYENYLIRHIHTLDEREH